MIVVLQLLFPSSPRQLQLFDSTAIRVFGWLLCFFLVWGSHDNIHKMLYFLMHYPSRSTDCCLFFHCVQPPYTPARIPIDCCINFVCCAGPLWPLVHVVVMRTKNRRQIKLVGEGRGAGWSGTNTNTNVLGGGVWSFGGAGWLSRLQWRWYHCGGGDMVIILFLFTCVVVRGTETTFQVRR